MELKLLTTAEKTSAKAIIKVAKDVFAQKFNSALVHQVVNAYRAGGRAGTRAQKSRSEVRGGGAKPWRQKGTGQARAGTIRSPIWRGGGVTFPSKTHDFSQKINKKMYCNAIRSILSELVRQDRLLVVEDFNVTDQKTRNLVKKVKELQLDQVLIVVDSIKPNLCLASRNLVKVAVCDVGSVNPVNLIGFEKVLFTVPALRKLEERLA